MAWLREGKRRGRLRSLMLALTNNAHVTVFFPFLAVLYDARVSLGYNTQPTFHEVLKDTDHLGMKYRKTLYRSYLHKMVCI